MNKGQLVHLVVSITSAIVATGAVDVFVPVKYRPAATTIVMIIAYMTGVQFNPPGTVSAPMTPAQQEKAGAIDSQNVAVVKKP